MSVWLERAGVMPLTVNEARRKGAWSFRKELANWREWAAAEAAGTPALVGPVTVTVTHLRPSRGGLPDTGAPFYAAKAVIDGLVDAGVLPEDGPAVVRRLTFEAPEIVGHHGLRVVVREVQQ